MKRGMVVLAVAMCIAWAFAASSGFAGQDPNDPYGPDSVLFRSRDLLVPCPPEAGQAVVPVYFRNDTPIIAVQVPLVWTGPAQLDSVSFFGSRLNYVYNKHVTIDNPNRKVLVTSSVGGQQPIAEGRGMLAKFYFSTSDTGLLLIDTLANSPLPGEHLQFTREDLVTYAPQYQQGQFHLVCGQDPNDPNVADTVSFCTRFAYYPLPSGPGLLYAHICVANDDSVGAMVLPLSSSGPIDFDSVTFRESVYPDSLWIVKGDSLEPKGLIALIPVYQPPIPPARGLFITLSFTLTDMTGIVQFDSVFVPPINQLLFTTTEPQGYRPQFVAGEIPVIAYLPGDANFDSWLDVADAVYLLNYIYKNGPIPQHPITSDMNMPDDLIDIEDVIYLLNYLFKHGPTPLPGDPWWPEKVYGQ
jgi:hypothetical protein